MHKTVFRRIIGFTTISALSSLLLLSPAQADMKKLQDSGTLKVAVYKNFAPFSDIEKGSNVGIDVDIAQAIAEKLNLKLSLLPFDAGEDMNDDLRNMVWKGHYLGYGPANVMMHVPVDKFLMAKNEQALIFGEYYREGIAMLRDIEKIPELKEVADLRKQKLAVEQGTGAASALLGADGGALKNDVRIEKDIYKGVVALQKGEVAGVYGGRAELEGAVQKLGLSAKRYQISSLPLNGIPAKGWVVGMAVKASERDVAKELENALRELEKSGKLDAIFAKYGVKRVVPNGRAN